MNAKTASSKLFEQATSSTHLQTRLELNKNSSSTDFTTWLLERLAVHEGEDVLDVGCGTGAQTIPFLDLVGAAGSVSCLDISAESIQALKRSAHNAPNLDAVVADMASVKECIQNDFRSKRYDLAHSSYALYYSPHRLHVLSIMRDSLKIGGRLAVFTPNRPHGMVDFVRGFQPIDPEIDESLAFGPSLLEPFFRKNFREVVAHFFHNRIRVQSTEDFVHFYRATTYYSEETEPSIRSAVDEVIRHKGFFEYEKNGYLIIGKDRLNDD